MLTSVWILLTLARLSLTAQIYLHPRLPKSELLPPHVSPSQARLVVSHHLGLDLFDAVGDTDNDVLDQIFQGSPFVGQGLRNGMILAVHDVVAQDVIPPSLTPTITLSKAASANTDLSLILSSFLRRAQHVYSSTYSSTSSSPLTAVPRLLDIFSLSTSDSTEAFLSEAASLVSFIETEEEDAFGAFELTGLTKLATEFGRESEQYKLAAETAQAILSSAMAKPNLHLAILTNPRSASPLDRRQAQPQPPQSPLPPSLPPPQLPIGAVSTCHPSSEACTNVTNACSGRGACSEASKAGKTCFVCACNVTLDDSGRRQWWVGDACERKDISGPFVLITGTVITIILVLAGAVSFLYSVGNQELPSTLTSGTAGGHSKRD